MATSPLNGLKLSIKTFSYGQKLYAFFPQVPCSGGTLLLFLFVALYVQNTGVR
jgi:hypothetical protein